MAPKAKSAPKQFNRVSSEVHAVTASGALIRNAMVYTDCGPTVKAHPQLVYVKCAVLPGTTAKVLKLKQIDPPGMEDHIFEAPANRCHNANDETTNDPQTLRDIGLLQHQNTAAVLDFLKSRFMANNIYTTADPLLVAVNPFRNVGWCSDDYVIQYRDTKNVATLPPHVFAIARNAQDNLIGIGKSQTIIVTGESGAGKTEATKHCMQFFASARGGIDLSIQKAVMAANPVLEAFGNAKTIRNNNSSRFGRFMRLIIANRGGIVNGQVQGFLLEKVRVVSQQPNERSYHIFYQFLKGASSADKQRYKLEPMSAYKNLNERSGGCYEADNINDVEEFKEVRQSFDSMQLSSHEIDSVLSIVAGVLKLGNVRFIGKNIDGQDNAAEIEPQSQAILKEACSLLFLDDLSKVATGLVSTLKTIGKEEVTVRVQQPEALALCASLCKAMYDSLFKWIIARLNKTIQPKVEPPSFMGMLDIFGFEIFEDNSLEQLLINITNEFLQKNFVDIVFERESKLYREEGVSTAELVFTDNREVIDCLIGRRGSVFALLEDTCVQKGTDVKFHQSMSGVMKDNRCFSVPPGGDRSLIFTIAHTIADISYSAVDFTNKNMDLLKAELCEVAQESSNPVVRAMFEDVKVERGKLAKGQLIASKFITQLDEMMQIIMTTEPHFIRCIKPNESKKPLDWVNDKVLNQLFSLSILEALQLKKLGFSYRRSFRDFVRSFRFLNMGLADAMERASDSVREKEIGVAMLHHVGKFFASQRLPFEDGKQWQIGKTMIFLKPEVVQAIVLMQHQAMEDFAPAVSLLESMYMRVVRRRETLKRTQGIVRAQSRIRQTLVMSGRSVSTTCPRPVVSVHMP